MAGRGPAPKDPSKRARRNADPIATTTLRFERAEDPGLPAELAHDPRMLNWWETWANSPQAEHFGSTDWLFLTETAFIAADFYAGDRKLASELRQRVAKFGATPEDRARLRMQFAQADEADAKRPSQPRARERRGTLHALPSADVG